MKVGNCQDHFPAWLHRPHYWGRQVKRRLPRESACNIQGSVALIIFGISAPLYVVELLSSDTTCIG
jgi:hypothetical protein